MAAHPDPYRPERRDPDNPDPWPKPNPKPNRPFPGPPDDENPYRRRPAILPHHVVPSPPKPQRPTPGPEFWPPPMSPAPDVPVTDNPPKLPDTVYMEKGTEGQSKGTYPDERREEAQQAALSNYYEKKSKHRGPQSGRVGNFGAGTQHPGHTGDSGLFAGYFRNVLGMNPDKKEQS